MAVVTNMMFCPMVILLGGRTDVSSDSGTINVLGPRRTRPPPPRGPAGGPEPARPRDGFLPPWTPGAAPPTTCGLGPPRGIGAKSARMAQITIPFGRHSR